MKRSPGSLIIRIALIYFACTWAARSERLPVTVFTSADGLGSSFVTCLMRDSRGFLWIGTRDGLSRFDGARFVTYQVGDSKAPPGIEQILETRKGIYWIVTTGGLFRFDPSAPVVNKPANIDRPTLNAEFVSSLRGFLFEDRQGNLWSGGDDFYRLEEKEKKLIAQRVELNLPVNSTTPFGVREMIESKDGSLWLISSWGLIRRQQGGSTTLYAIDPITPNRISGILEDSTGRIWVGLANDIYILKPDSFEDSKSDRSARLRDLRRIARRMPNAVNGVKLPEKSGEVFDCSAALGAVPGHQKFFLETRDKHIWISDASRVIEFDGQAFVIHSSTQGLVQESSMMIEDGSGNLWFGNSTSLMRLNRAGLTTYGPNDGLRSGYVMTINQTLDGKPYLMGSEFGLSVFQDNSFQTIRPRLPLSAEATWTSNAGFQDSAGEWWFLTRDKLYRFAPTKDFRDLTDQSPRATYDQRDGLKGKILFHVFEDSRHDLWFSTEDPAGLSLWNRAAQKFRTFTEADGLPEKNIASFAEDKSGNLWFGFYVGGLVRYAKSRFEYFSGNDGFPGGLITALYVDRQGRLWIGSSQEGVNRIDDPSALHPQLISYTTGNGLASNNIRAITGDLYGNIYFGTARGVDRISVDGKRIKHYSIDEGLAGDFVSAAFCDQSGALWFGTTSGVSRLVPTQEVTTTAPPILISALTVAGERRLVPELGSTQIPLIEIPHSQNNLQVDFFGIDFGAGENLRYQYRLEGADQDWSAPTLQRSVTFANLAPGSYRFLVRAVSPDGLVSVTPATISLRILPPVWQRWWFLTIAAIMSVGFLYALYSYRVAQLLKVERVRTRIATDLHDDIGASLSRMAILSEVVKQQTLGKGDQATSLLTEIADSARGLVDSMGDIVWSIDPRRDDLQSVVRRIRQFASDVLEAKGIQWELRVPHEVESLKLGPDERQHLFLIFKEGINNIARHGEGTKSVSLSIEREGRQLIGEIKDDGCGFTPEQPDEQRSKGRGGNGLPNMRERTRQLGGRLEIASSPGTGTRLTLKVPIR
jgi:signal transduction histidine kinase/ligand-binding sensor domain-containing protein